jgi:trans-2,3-dihydro-3-hydroxyanthranilate isomerase
MSSAPTGGYSYRLVNVFAERPFTGKSVAVFTDASGLSDVAMASIARELNLPQCAFVFPASDEVVRSGGARARVRVFTPTRELPRAGLPTIATVFALELDARGVVSSRPTPRAERVVLEQSTGPISVSGFAPLLTTRGELPKIGAVYPERETVAALLSLTPQDLVQAPLVAVASEVPYLVVPVTGPDALDRIVLRSSIWERTLQRFEAPNVIAFFLGGSSSPALAHMRVFAPALGVWEEPASEHACGPLLGYLLHHKLVTLPEHASVALKQGELMGRPSTLHAALTHRDGRLQELRVGGQCISVSEGVFFA